jgi:phospholipid transport system substrate-binding protein
MVRPQGAPPIKVDWRLSTRDGLYKISDVVVEGVGMGASERSEFASVIRRSGGELQGLLAMMRERIAGRPLESSVAPPVVGDSSSVR